MFAILAVITINFIVEFLTLLSFTCGSPFVLFEMMCLFMGIDLWVLCVPPWVWTCGSCVSLCGYGLVSPVCPSVDMDLWVLCVPP